MGKDIKHTNKILALLEALWLPKGDCYTQPKGGCYKGHQNTDTPEAKGNSFAEKMAISSGFKTSGASTDFCLCCLTSCYLLPPPTPKQTNKKLKNKNKKTLSVTKDQNEWKILLDQKILRH